MPPIEEHAPEVVETLAEQSAEVAPDAQTENQPAQPEITEPETVQAPQPEPTEEPSPALPADDPVETPAVDPVSVAVVEAVAAAQAESPVPLQELAINTVAELVARIQEEFGITVAVKEIADDPAAVELVAEVKDGAAERTAQCVVRNDDKAELLGFYFSVVDASIENKMQNRAANA